ncbi:MAG: ParA family protein [Verrucomicrobiales bacterium]|nr:ParA family protein [Verrucomicrobiales bacterium]
MIVSLINSKGGVGKSTLAVHLTAWWQRQGRRVALVDADTQGSSSTWLREAASDIPVLRLQSADEILDEVPGLHQEYEHLVVDGPAGLAEISRAILLVTDWALLPCGPSVLDLRAATEAVRVVMQARQIRQGPPRATLVPNKLQLQHRLSRELLAALGELPVDSAGGLSLRQAYADAAGQGALVWELGSRGRVATRELMGVLHGLIGQGT